MTKQISNIVIVGGGTAGWMTAASLARYFTGKKVDISLIESTAIGTVGVGEATIPNIVDFNNQLGIDEVEFVKATQATFKLGIQFENWHKKDSQFFHPFADYGVTIDNIEFHQYLQKLAATGETVNLEDYCFSIAMAKLGNFAQPHPNPPSPLADYSYAYHFDAGLYANFLKRFSINLGVKHIDAKVSSVKLKDNNGFIESVELDGEENITGELFIDCSGFSGLLIEKALKTGYEDWSHWLFCDRAMAIQTQQKQGNITPFTRVTARESGWQWCIPLQSRTGNGYIYSSKFESDESAQKTLLDNLEGKPITEVRQFSFTPGRRKKMWNKNCVAIGLSSGFLEPLESTSISLIQSGIAKLLTFFPDTSFNPSDASEVNRLHNQELENVRDFIILHYKLNERDDSQFWQTCNAMEVPETLAHKMALFKNRGHLLMYSNDSFEKASWLTMYNAFQYKSERYDVRANSVDNHLIKEKLAQMKSSIQEAARKALTHSAFIEKHCKAD